MGTFVSSVLMGLRVCEGENGGGTIVDLPGTGSTGKGIAGVLKALELALAGAWETTRFVCAGLR